MTASVALKKEDDNYSARLVFSGNWLFEEHPDHTKKIIEELSAADLKKITLNGKEIEQWDSLLVAFLVRVLSVCKEKSIQYELLNFPQGVDSLIDLAFAVPQHVDTGKVVYSQSFLTYLGNVALHSWAATKTAYFFARQAYASVVRLLMRRAVVRKVDILSEIQKAGANAFPIVSLICFLVGLILAFVGSIQLKMFGAQIYVSSLVAIAVTRVMGAIMGGVIMAGRTGASYAATLGSMQVNEEIDALKTMGISPFDFLVLPRVLALSLMMPLLTVYADLMGIMGGAFVGVFMLDLSPEDYFRMTMKALSMKNIIIGIIHGSVYGVIIALCGCYQGINCGRNASAVGYATTAAVVNSIVWMTVATAFLTFLFSVSGV